MQNDIANNFWEFRSGVVPLVPIWGGGFRGWSEGLGINPQLGGFEDVGSRVLGS